MNMTMMMMMKINL